MESINKEISSWKSYIKLWLSFIFLAFIFLWDNDFELSNSVFSKSLALYAFWAGLLFFLELNHHKILKKNSLRKYLNTRNWIPYFINFLFIILSFIYLYQENMYLFKFVTLGIPISTFLVVLVIIIYNKYA